MIVDSSVWIDHLDGRSNPATARLAVQLQEDETQVLVGDLIVHEVLRGMRSPKRRAAILQYFQTLSIVNMVDLQRSVRSATRYAELRTKGITIRKTTDVLIAGYCLDEDESLLFADRDFLHFVTHYGLVRA